MLKNPGLRSLLFVEILHCLMGILSATTSFANFEKVPSPKHEQYEIVPMLRDAEISSSRNKRDVSSTSIEDNSFNVADILEEIRHMRSEHRAKINALEAKTVALEEEIHTLRATLKQQTAKLIKKDDSFEFTLGETKDAAESALEIVKEISVSEAANQEAVSNLEIAMRVVNSTLRTFEKKHVDLQPLGLFRGNENILQLPCGSNGDWVPISTLKCVKILHAPAGKREGERICGRFHEPGIDIERPGLLRVPYSPQDEYDLIFLLLEESSPTDLTLWVDIESDSSPQIREWNTLSPAIIQSQGNYTFHVNSNCSQLHLLPQQQTDSNSNLPKAESECSTTARVICQKSVPLSISGIVNSAQALEKEQEAQRDFLKVWSDTFTEEAERLGVGIQDARKEAADRSTKIEASVTLLQATDREHSASLRNLENVTTSHSSSITSLHSTTRNLNSMIDNLFSTTSSQASSINSLTTKTSSHSTRINSLFSAVDSHTSLINGAYSTAKKQQSSIRSLETYTQSQTTRISHVESTTQNLLRIANSLQDQINNQGDSCLRQGTQILMADRTTKAVEQIKVGDKVLDHFLQECAVKGVSYEFLASQKFYGFDNHTFFFTESHIMVGSAQSQNNDGDGVEFYVKDLKWLISQNPLMQYIVKNEFNFSTPYSIYHYDRSEDSIFPKEVQVFQDPQKYPEDTPIYFIQVDSPHGTYFANGYVCRHEIPPTHLWPNTMAVLITAVKSVDFNSLLERIKFTPEFIAIVNFIAIEAKKFVEETILLYSHAKYLDSSYGAAPVPELENIDQETFFEGMFQCPKFVAVSTKLYAHLGPIIAPVLDNKDGVVAKSSISGIKTMKQTLVSELTRKLQHSFSKHFKIDKF